MKKHNFLCIGFTKCGTTTLHEILKQHKDIYLPIIKEPLYYYDSELYKKGFNWYKKRFYPKNITKKYLGEINPSITLKENSKKVFRDYGNDIKLIFLMRNPVNRTYSDFKYAERNIYIDTDKKDLNHTKRFDYIISKTFKRNQNGSYELINSPYKNIFRIGNYYSIIEKYIKYYPISNIKFILFEEFIKDPQKICEELLVFLNIPLDKNINYNIKANEGNYKKRNEFCGNISDLIFNIHTFILTHTCYLGNRLETIEENLWNILNKLIMTKDKDKTKIGRISKNILEDFYREDKNKLKIMINKDLDNIWFK